MILFQLSLRLKFHNFINTIVLVKMLFLYLGSLNIISILNLFSFNIVLYGPFIYHLSYFSTDLLKNNLVSLLYRILLEMFIPVGVNGVCHFSYHILIRLSNLSKCHAKVE